MCNLNHKRTQFIQQKGGKYFTKKDESKLKI